jgi:hypothetical protein
LSNGASCPAAPKGTPIQGDASTDGKKVRCELPCSADKDCKNGRICVPKSSQTLFGTQLQAVAKVCLDLDKNSHHNFDSPFEQDPNHAQCKETTDKGVEIQELEITDNKKAYAICGNFWCAHICFFIVCYF